MDGKKVSRKNQIGFEVRTLDHMIGRKIMNISLENGMDRLTVMHGWIIRYLYENQDRDIYQKDLETQFCITRSSVTNILQLMERKGYIQRIPVEWDARLKKIVLTEKAKMIQKQTDIDVHRRVEEQLAKGITEEELSLFLDIIRRIKKNLEEERR